MKTKIILLFLSIITFNLSAQKRVYIGLDFSKVQDRLIDSNPTSNIVQAYPHFVNPNIALSLGYRLNSIVSIESGLVLKPYSAGFSYQESPTELMSYGAIIKNRWQIPLRLRTTLPLYKDKIFISTALGYHLGVNSDDRTLSYVIGSDNIGYRIEDQVSKFYHLIEANLSLEYKINDRWTIIGTTSLFNGLSPAKSSKIQEYNQDQIVDENTLIDTGSYNSFGFGVRYNLFKNKPAYKSNAKDIKID